MRNIFFIPAFILSLLSVTYSHADLLKGKDIVQESQEDVLARHLKNSDTVLLVCVYESRYVPLPEGKGHLWDKASQTRIVQTLRGTAPVGGILILHRKDESLPPSGLVREEEGHRFISTQEPGYLWYVFLNSKELKQDKQGTLTGSLSTMFMNPLKIDDEDGMDSFRKLLHIEPAKIAEESEAARFQPESGE